MIDRKQIHYSEQLDRNLAAGATVQNEGMILCEMVQNGGAVVFTFLLHKRIGVCWSSARFRQD